MPEHHGYSSSTEQRKQVVLSGEAKGSQDGLVLIHVRAHKPYNLAGGQAQTVGVCVCVWTSVTKRTQVFAITQHIS